MMKIDKEMLEKIINEVRESGADKKITLTCDGYIKLEFDMLEYNLEPYPVCNVYLYDLKDNLIKNLFVTDIKKGNIVTEGSIDEIFKSCEFLDANIE